MDGAESDPYHLVERGEDVRRVLAALDELPSAQQEVLRLRFQEELTYKEISAITTHSVSNVGFLIHTAIRQLRRRLQADERAIRVEGGRTDA